jgi:hypothetical protein
MLICMRTTIEIDDRVFRELKREAAELGTTLRKVVNDRLSRSVHAPKPREKYKFKWKVDPRGKMLPGVQLNDRKSLFDLMDGL